MCEELRVLATSDAARAFIPGSPELTALPSQPAGVPVMAVAAQTHTEGDLGFVTYHLTSEEPGDDGTGDMIVARPYALAQNRTARPLGGTTTIDCGTLSFGATTDWSKVNCTHITETNDTRFLTIAHRRERRVARSAAISRAGPRRNGRGEPVESRPAVPASRVA